jgi:hydrogenase expression/formation protein HypD
MSDQRALAATLAAEINAAASRIGRDVRIMEVCGTHTVELRRQGVHSLLPRSVRLVSGPGCPVCVTPTGYIDNAISLAESGRAIVASFGDMLKVPGSTGRSLSSLTGRGLARLVYSPSELPALARAASLPLVFLAVGFETTIPTVVSALAEATEDRIDNLSFYTGFKTVPAALRFLLAGVDHGLDGFLLPGHVSVIIGAEAYGFLERPGGRPGVIAGFEALDMLLGILMVLRQILRGQSLVQNAYPRAVKPGGNPLARALIERFLEPCDEQWRGLGRIPGASLRLRPECAARDAATVFSLPEAEDIHAPGCICARVVAGAATPVECALFGAPCTPDDPIGPCMVSSEGTCAAYFRYGADR